MKFFFPTDKQKKILYIEWSSFHNVMMMMIMRLFCCVDTDNGFAKGDNMFWTCCELLAYMYEV